MGTPWGESTTCTSCGKCVQVCPTGALFEKGRSVAEAKRRRPFLPYLPRSSTQTSPAMTRPRLATVWLDGCSGCHMSFLDMDERLLDAGGARRPRLQPAGRHQGVSGRRRRHARRGRRQHRGRPAQDRRGPAADQDPRLLRRLRGDVERARACATRSAPQPLLERAYLENVTLNPGIPDRVVPALLPTSRPVHPVVDVDVFLPGCPPSADLIYSVLDELLAGRIPTRRASPTSAREDGLPGATMNEIVIDPVTRIEGHSKITIQLDDDGAVTDAHFHVTQFRGFERICQGRPLTRCRRSWPASAASARSATSMASAKACDEILAVSPPEVALEPAAGHEPGPDRPVARAQLLPSLLARPAVRLGRRSGAAQPVRRCRREPAARARRHRPAARSASRSSSASAASASTRPGSSPAA